MRADYLDTLIERQNQATRLHGSQPLCMSAVRRWRAVLEDVTVVE